MRYLQEVEDLLDPVVTPKQLEQATGIKASTWASFRSTGTGPRYLKLGDRITYPKESVIAYLQEAAGMPVDTAPELTALEESLDPMCKPGDLTLRCGFARRCEEQARSAIHAVKVGRAWRYPRANVIQYMRQHIHQATHEYERD